jgi:hypothetical protein
LVKSRSATASIRRRARFARRVYHVVLVVSLALLGTSVIRAVEGDVASAALLAVLGAGGAAWAFARRYGSNGTLNPASIHKRGKSH